MPHLAFTLLSLFILVFGMFSALIKERIYLGEAASKLPYYSHSRINEPIRRLSLRCQLRPPLE